MQLLSYKYNCYNLITIKQINVNAAQTNLKQTKELPFVSVVRKNFAWLKVVKNGTAKILVFIDIYKVIHLQQLKNSRVIEKLTVLVVQYGKRFLARIMENVLNVDVFGVQEENT